MSNENNMGDLLGGALNDIKEEGLMGAGKKLAGNMLGNFLQGLTGGAETEEDEETEEASDEEEETEETPDAEEDETLVVNNNAGSYEDNQVAANRDHDVDDEIDGHEDDTSAQQNSLA